MHMIQGNFRVNKSIGRWDAELISNVIVCMCQGVYTGSLHVIRTIVIVNPGLASKQSLRNGYIGDHSVEEYVDAG